MRTLFAGIACLCLGLPGAALTAAQTVATNGSGPPAPTLHPITIPRLQAAPAIEEFSTMRANGGAASQMAFVEGFLQARPRDGEPASQTTQGYLGYDDRNLYVVFVCFDTDPEKIRAHLSRRDDAWGDDWVELTLDTFLDDRRGYVFWSNALGVQADGLWNETGGGPDWSFDTVWHTRGLRTSRGFVVLMAIPFRSLRFTSADVQTWGITLQRVIQRNNEWSYWPRISANVRGRLSQDAQMDGLRNISPGRNLQFIPYGVFRSFRAVDARDPAGPRVTRNDAEFDGGLDAKFVFKDSLVLDVTLNPDFAQVESDDPQIVTNQRFEVFFPEKRPFFLENAGFFQVANGLNLLFTRRIADPQFGARLTGKIGKYSVGAILADDQSPGREVISTHSLAGKRALFGVLRVTRDVFKQSSLGFMFTDREFSGQHNRVAAMDATFRWSQKWQATVQGATSATKLAGGSTLDGPMLTASIHRSGRQFFTDAWYNDISPGFRTLAGFIPRTDFREIGNFTGYNFRPEGKVLISWGPDLGTFVLYDHQGTRLEWRASTSLEFEFAGNTNLEFSASAGRERLRPADFSALAANRDYSKSRLGIDFETARFHFFTVGGGFQKGHTINFAPVAGAAPFPANFDRSSLFVNVRPITPLTIQSRYIWFRLREAGPSTTAFNNHILRQNWNWQFTRALSLRMILQYQSILANQTRTSLETSKNFNADFLLTWLLHPGTALYVGYNSNLVNNDIFPCATASCSTEFRRTADLRNDAKGLFVKFSYLFRF